MFHLSKRRDALVSILNKALVWVSRLAGIALAIKLFMDVLGT